MKKICRYCGRVCERDHVCKNKPKISYDKQKDAKYRFRGSRLWKRKRSEILRRDLGLCQLCKRGVMTDRKELTAADAVHHIISLEADFDRRLDSYDLISLCSYHHELAENGRISAEILLDIAEEQEKAQNVSAI